jgi:hypothetical protein
MPSFVLLPDALAPHGCHSRGVKQTHLHSKGEKMMGQQQTVAEQQAGGTLRRIMLVVLVAALMALTMAASAMPALAKGGENFGGHYKGEGDGYGGSSQSNGSEQGVINKDKSGQGGVYNNPHRPVVVVIDSPFPTP